MRIKKSLFGVTKDGRQAFLYTMANANGMEVSVTNFGAILVNLFVPDVNGAKKDLVLGYDRLADYEVNDCFFGAVLGRNANRIEGAAFTLDHVKYQITDNENGNNLHTDDTYGFHKQLWTACADEPSNAVKFSYISPDGETGFPGTVKVSVTYTLHPDNSLQITYDGVSDKKTILNLTNHSYFNLRGHDAGSICDEIVTIHASGFTEVKAGLVPTGRILPVEGTPMDFRMPRRIGEAIDSDFGQLKLAGGYDHNWALDTVFGKVEKIAEVEDKKAGLSMEVYTDLPGVQFYTGNFIVPQTGKGGVHYGKRCALCLETQYFPNSVNIPEFRQPVIEAGEAYHTTTIYRFRQKSF